MEFTKEFIQETGLNEEQVASLIKVTNDYEADLTTTLKGEAVTNAENIISGAGKKTIELTGVERNAGEKWADYLERASSLYFKGTREALERDQTALTKKLKEGGGNEALKAEIDTMTKKIDALKIKEAEYDDWKANDYKGKYEQTYKELEATNERVAFSSVKPAFPNTVNRYEAKAIWSEFIKNTKEVFNIVRDPEADEYYAVDKDNEHKRFKLEDLVKKDEALNKLTEGRKLTGPGADPKQKVKIEGLPFEVEENATPQERQKAIKEYLASQNIAKHKAEYAQKFKEYNAILLGKTPAKK